MSPSDSPDHPGSIFLYHSESSEVPIPQTSDWSGTFFFAVSYSKPAKNEIIMTEKPIQAAQ